MRRWDIYYITEITSRIVGILFRFFFVFYSIFYKFVLFGKYPYAAPINSCLNVVVRSPAPYGLGRNGCWPSRGSQLPWALPFMFSLCCPLNDRSRAAPSISTVELVLPRHARCVLSRPRSNGHNLLLSSCL